MARRRKRPRKRPPCKLPYGAHYWEVAVQAGREVLCQDLLDKYWEELEEIQSRPEIQEAARVIAKAIAERYAPRPISPSGRKRRSRSSRPKRASTRR